MNTTVKDPMSALTHFAGMIIAVFAMPFLLVHAVSGGMEQTKLAGLSIFILSMICLYGASSAYHTFDISERGNRILKKLDHTMIYVLIAGSYTPICLSILPESSGIPLLIVIWSIAFAGAVFTMFFVYCPKWISSVLYIAMGWACAFVLPGLLSQITYGQFALLLGGGLLYTAGGVIYAMKFKKLEGRAFGSHEIFHVFVLAGSFCHFLFMWYAV